MYEPIDDILRKTNEATLQESFPEIFKPLQGSWTIAFAKVAYPAVARLEALYPGEHFSMESEEHVVPETNQTVFFYNLLDSLGNHVWDCTVVAVKRAPTVYETKQLLFQWHAVFFELKAEGGASC
jgi:hypothetical protein